jgi:hypothetical protein
MEEPSEPVKTPDVPFGWRKIAVWPTLSYEPRINAKVRVALERKDWRALRSLRVVWYDKYSGRWFTFTKHFFDHIDYALVSHNE